MSFPHASGVRRRAAAVVALTLALTLAACTPPAPPPPAAAAAPAPLPARQTVHLALTPPGARCTVRQGSQTYEGVGDGDAVELDRTEMADLTCRTPGRSTVRVHRAPAFDFSAPAGQQAAFPDVVSLDLGR